MLKKLALFLLLLLNLLPEVAHGEPGEYVVLGVIASNQNQGGVALLKHKASGKVSAHREGSSLGGDVTITRIYRKQVFFSFRGESYTMAVGDDVAIAANGRQTGTRNGPDFDSNDLKNREGIELKDSTLVVNAALKEALVQKKLHEILMQAASEPHVENGRLVGFKLWDIEKGSIFDAAGFSDGDLITAINSQPINSAATAIRILNQLRNASDAEVEFVRGGTTKTLKIVVQ